MKSKTVRMKQLDRQLDPTPIISMYLRGLSVEEISGVYNLRVEHVWRLLKARGIVLRQTAKRSASDRPRQVRLGEIDCEALRQHLELVDALAAEATRGPFVERVALLTRFVREILGARRVRHVLGDKDRA